jgi:hypothetical protein
LAINFFTRLVEHTDIPTATGRWRRCTAANATFATELGSVRSAGALDTTTTIECMGQSDGSGRFSCTTEWMVNESATSIAGILCATIYHI